MCALATVEGGSTHSCVQFAAPPPRSARTRRRRVRLAVRRLRGARARRRARSSRCRPRSRGARRRCARSRSRALSTLLVPACARRRPSGTVDQAARAPRVAADFARPPRCARAGSTALRAVARCVASFEQIDGRRRARCFVAYWREAAADAPARVVAATAPHETMHADARAVAARACIARSAARRGRLARARAASATAFVPAASPRPAAAEAARPARRSAARPRAHGGAFEARTGRSRKTGMSDDSAPGVSGDTYSAFVDDGDAQDRPAGCPCSRTSHPGSTRSCSTSALSRSRATSRSSPRSCSSSTCERRICAAEPERRRERGRRRAGHARQRGIWLAKTRGAWSGRDARVVANISTRSCSRHDALIRPRRPDGCRSLFHPWRHLWFLTRVSPPPQFGGTRRSTCFNSFSRIQKNWEQATQVRTGAHRGHPTPPAFQRYVIYNNLGRKHLGEWTSAAEQSPTEPRLRSSPAAPPTDHAYINLATLHKAERRVNRRSRRTARRCRDAPVAHVGAARLALMLDFKVEEAVHTLDALSDRGESAPAAQERTTTSASSTRSAATGRGVGFGSSSRRSTSGCRERARVPRRPLARCRRARVPAAAEKPV